MCLLSLSAHLLHLLGGPNDVDYIPIATGPGGRPRALVLFRNRQNATVLLFLSTVYASIYTGTVSPVSMNTWYLVAAPVLLFALYIFMRWGAQVHIEAPYVAMLLAPLALLLFLYSNYFNADSTHIIQLSQMSFLICSYGAYSYRPGIGAAYVLSVTVASTLARAFRLRFLGVAEGWGPPVMEIVLGVAVTVVAVQMARRTGGGLADVADAPSERITVVGICDDCTQRIDPSAKVEGRYAFARFSQRELDECIRTAIYRRRIATFGRARGRLFLVSAGNVGLPDDQEPALVSQCVCGNDLDDNFIDDPMSSAYASSLTRADASRTSREMPGDESGPIPRATASFKAPLVETASLSLIMDHKYARQALRPRSSEAGASIAAPSLVVSEGHLNTKKPGAPRRMLNVDSGPRVEQTNLMHLHGARDSYNRMGINPFEQYNLPRSPSPSPTKRRPGPRYSEVPARMAHVEEEPGPRPARDAWLSDEEYALPEDEEYLAAFDESESGPRLAVEGPETHTVTRSLPPTAAGSMLPRTKSDDAPPLEPPPAGETRMHMTRTTSMPMGQPLRVLSEKRLKENRVPAQIPPIRIADLPGTPPLARPALREPIMYSPTRYEREMLEQQRVPPLAPPPSPRSSFTRSILDSDGAGVGGGDNDSVATPDLDASVLSVPDPANVPMSRLAGPSTITHIPTSTGVKVLLEFPFPPLRKGFSAVGPPAAHTPVRDAEGSPPYGGADPIQDPTSLP